MAHWVGPSASLSRRQGGILSPRIFVVYVDDLLKQLRKSGIGCHIIDQFMAAIMYADDLALLAPTRCALQKLLDICNMYGDEWCITYNSKKTLAMVFGRSVHCSPLYLNDVPITFVTECKYLGITVATGSSGNFFAPVAKFLAGFYCASNTILNTLSKPSEHIQMHLLYTNCVPKLTYACEVRGYSSRDMSNMDVALNDAIRKIFSFNRWESTRFLRKSFGYDSITEIFSKRNKSFIHKIQFLDNPLLKFLRKHSL